MANDQKSDPVKAARAHLEALAREPRAAMFGLSKPLRALDAALAEHARRQSVLANAIAVIESAINAEMRHKGYVHTTLLTEDFREQIIEIFEAGRT